MTEASAGERQPLPSLYRVFAEGLRDTLVTDLATVSLDAKPLDLACRPPLPSRVRLYIFNCTDHPSERRAGDYRIQLRLPGQRRRERGELALAPGAMLLLAGFVSEFDVFVLWDANAHQEFPYSKGVQVAAGTVHRAAIRGIAEQQRDIRGIGYREHVVAVRSDRLVEGIRRRQELSWQANIGELAPLAGEMT